ncbi:MAG: SpoVR family protein, partial [Phycisphaerae bacterium]
MQRSRFTAELAEEAVEVEHWARQEGLDFYQTIFELVDFETMNQIAAYGGFPRR